MPHILSDLAQHEADALLNDAGLPRLQNFGSKPPQSVHELRVEAAHFNRPIVLSLLAHRQRQRGVADPGVAIVVVLAGLDSASPMPLQVLYGIRGACHAEERTLEGVEGYAGSKPVRIGNHAAGQLQMDSLGYLAESAHIYLQQGGNWKPVYSRLMERIAGFTAANWKRPDNGIWELDEQHHFVSSKVMAWVVFDRAAKMSGRLGLTPYPGWAPTARMIHEEVMLRGWSKQRQAFRQHYDSEELDASTLLLGGMDFLPRDHPRRPNWREPARSMSISRTQCSRPAWARCPASHRMPGITGRQSAGSW